MGRSAPPIVPEVFKTFTRLNSKTSYYTSSREANPTNNGPSEPGLIILTTWMDAGKRHIAKYVEHYKQLYPSASILLITASTTDFFSTKQRLSHCKPAVSVIRKFVDEGKDARGGSGGGSGDRGGILVHAMSNGGSGNFTFLSKAYYEATGTTLPAKAVILDSTPGKSRFKQGLQTLSQGLRAKPLYIRLPAQLLLAFLLLVVYMIPEALGIETPAIELWTSLNNEEYISKEAKRCYIYSEEDESILGSDVLAHAEEAETKGFNVERICFVGSRHVAHMRMDPERYWSTVTQTWED